MKTHRAHDFIATLNQRRNNVVRPVGRENVDLLVC